ASNPFYPNQNTTELNPFPYDITPPVTCFDTQGTNTSIARPTYSSSPNPPYAGITVTLDGTASTPPSGPFHWQQIINPGDPVITLSDTTAAKPTFLAPTVTGAEPDLPVDCGRKRNCAGFGSERRLRGCSNRGSPGGTGSGSDCELIAGESGGWRNRGNAHRTRS